MNEHPSTPKPATSGIPGFDERLSVPWWWYLPAVGVAALLGAEIHMGYPGLRSWIGYAVVVPVAVGVLVWLGRTRVRVREGRLHAGEESVAVDSIGRVEVIRDRDAKQVALGPDLDPAAHLLHRAWIRPVVRLEITDPDADVPYWVISVSDPDRLLAALGR
ncbi:DUF3093 domain-containing protein [Pseudonocardia sp.]|uniref:DUF3093 domain-containing protein n=1 Tax=Pseudonocardia sp. TaxID=60912 RepID=UPI00261309D4|nr:DUF3093 domain-containing protein [Pseudonocardia sp.]